MAGLRCTKMKEDARWPRVGGGVGILDWTGRASMAEGDQMAGTRGSTQYVRGDWLRQTVIPLIGQQQRTDNR